MVKNEKIQQREVSILRPLSYEPNAIPLRHPALSTNSHNTSHLNYPAQPILPPHVYYYPLHSHRLPPVHHFQADIYSIIPPIKIRMHERVRSATKILPQPQGNIVRQRQLLENYSRQLFSKQTSRSTNYRNSSAPFTASSRTRPLLHTPSPSPNSDFQILRPFTESGGKCHRRSYSPLQVIRTRSKCESQQTLQVQPVKSTPILKAKFLRKGSALDKAVITNVLKSKLNSNISASIFSYGDVAANKQIAQMVSAQIPKGVRDVVGVEEMMRMSHILTGANFKTVSLTHKLNKRLVEGRRRDSTLHDDEDHLTLRSIKRW